MIEHGSVVMRSAASPVAWVNFWQPVGGGQDPDEEAVVWVCVPREGNDDDGYGMVMLAQRSDCSGGGSLWWSVPSGSALFPAPAFWAPVLVPEYPFITPATPDEAAHLVAGAWQHIQNRTGPYAHHARAAGASSQEPSP